MNSSYEVTGIPAAVVGVIHDLCAQFSLPRGGVNINIGMTAMDGICPITARVITWPKDTEFAFGLDRKWSSNQPAVMWHNGRITLRNAPAEWFSQAGGSTVDVLFTVVLESGHHVFQALTGDRVSVT